MLVFVGRRLGQAIPVLFGISLLVFFLMHAMPGGPLAVYLHQPGITAQEIKNLKAAYGINHPIWIQYVDWLGRAVRGDFGYSYTYGLPATTMLWQRVPATLEMVLPAFALSVIASFVLGVATAYRHHTLWDYVVSALSYVGISMPVFWLGTLVVLVFAVDLHWFPAGGITSLTGAGGLMARLHYLALPVLVLAFNLLAYESRYVRSTVLDVLHLDYIRTAKAKGVSNVRVLWVHALRTALLPVVTVLIMDGAYLMGGAIVTETIFSWPGMGRLFIQSVDQGDYPVMMVTVAFVAVVIVLANIAADLLYAALDPRVRYE